MVTAHQLSKSSYDAWKDLLINYEGDKVKVELAEKVHNQLENLRLDSTIPAL